MRTSILSTAALSVAALTLTHLAPATADGIGVRDPADLDHGVDLRSVVVDHGAEDIVVTTTHRNLRPSFRTGSAGAVYLDTDLLDAGPEYVFVGGYFVGTDYTLVATEGFGNRQWGDPVDGSYRMRLDFTRDRVRMRISRGHRRLTRSGQGRRPGVRHPPRRHQRWTRATGSESRAASPSGWRSRPPTPRWSGRGRHGRTGRSRPRRC